VTIGKPDGVGHFTRNDEWLAGRHQPLTPPIQRLGTHPDPENAQSPLVDHEWIPH
jgi:hypothetical protein